MGPDFELRVLGGIEVVRGGQAVPIGGPKPRLVLALLAIHRGSVVSTERLCEELWGDDRPVDPAGVLQSHVSRLRRILRPEAEIVGRAPGYVLQLPDEAIDADRFEARCAQAAQAANHETTIKLLETALNSWRGAAFEEFVDFDWAAREAVRLDELRANAQEDLFDARLATGAHAALVGELESLVAERPLRERLWSQLIVALYRGGRSAEALRRAAAYRSLLREELGLEPSPAFRELETRVLSDDPTLQNTIEVAERVTSRRLPAEATELIGRDGELAELTRHVRGSRLVTLTGPGGVGKTRLALRLAGELWDEFDGEVFVVELDSVHDPASTTAAIATAVDVRQRQHLSVEETLLEYLRARRTLLVLDNCEHLRDSVASLAEQILGWCPQVTIIASSREVLGLPGELVWRVEPLETPCEDCDEDTALANASVRLFLQRADRARPGFALTPENVTDVVEVVRRVDGLPLAIELAAARLRVMGPSALATRLVTSFELLSGAQTSMTARHRTVHDLVVWSHDLLDSDEQRLFARLSVFAGGFGLDAVEAVCADERLGASKASMVLANLVDKSMVQLIDENVPRYRLLETLREYGSRHLDDEERRMLRRQHAWWYLEVAELCAQMLTGPEEPDAVAILDRDFANLRAAHLWSIECADVEVALRLVAGLREFAFRRMRAEAMSWAEAATALSGAERHERFPVVLAVAAYDRYVRGDLDTAIELGESALAAAEALDSDCSGLAERALANALFFRHEIQRGLEFGERLVASARSGSAARLAHALYMRSVAHTSVGESIKGAQLAGEARAAATACGSPTAHAEAAYALGVALESTNPVEAAAHLQQSTDFACRAGNRWMQAFALTEVLSLEARQGRPREALARYSDVIDLWSRGGDWANLWLSLRHLLGIFAQLEAYEQAATLHGAIVAADAAYALPFEKSGMQHVNALADRLREDLGGAAFAAAVRRGAALTDSEILDFARQSLRALAPDARAASG